MMARITPEIVVSNMDASMEFYSVLGFVQDNVGIVDENGSQWYSLAMGDSNVWLLRRDVAGDMVEGGMLGNGVHLYLRVDDVDATYEHLRVKGVPVVKEIETLWYGLREFKVADPDGYVWTINTPVTEQAEDSMDGGD
jgi:PhnB protein